MMDLDGVLQGNLELAGSLQDNAELSGTLSVGEIIGGEGTTNYNNLENKPQINGVELRGNKSSQDFGIQEALVSGTNIKTINNQSLLGSGNITIQGGSGGSSVPTFLSGYKYFALGDSIVWNQGQGRVGYVQAIRDRYGVIPSNFGASGHTLAQDYNTLYNKNYSDVALVTIAYGVNDARTGCPLGTVDSENVSTFAGALNMLLKKIYTDNKECRVIVLTPIQRLVVNNFGSWTPNTNGDTLQDFVDMALAVAGRNSTRAIDMFRNCGLNQTNLAYYTTEGVHPETAGYLRMTNTIIPVIDDLLKVQFSPTDSDTTPTVELSSITANYTQSGTVYPSDSIDSLKTDLVVKAIYSDSSQVTLQDSNYTLSGTLSTGTSTITVSYGGKTTTFNVTVSQPVELSSISAVYTQSGTVYTTDTLDSLKSNLVVTANYTDSSTRTVSDYTLSGTLSEGTSTITVSYSGKTTTFDVTVTTPPTLSSIDATFTQGGATIYEGANLDTLKQYLVVVATYSDSSTITLQDSDYTLSGTLTEGTSTITVTYEDKTDTFDVTVLKGNVIDGTDLTWETGFINASGSVDKLGSTTTNSGSWTSSYYSVQGYSTALVTLDGSTIQRNAYYDANKAFISRALVAESEIPATAVYARATITKSSLGHTSYDGTGATITLS